MGNFVKILSYILIFLNHQHGCLAFEAAIASLGDTAQALSRNGPNRNIVIQITNHLDVPLFGGDYFLERGYNSEPAPPIIRPKTREVMQFRKVGDTATGTSGVIAYKIGNEEDVARFALIFSVPFNYIHRQNWFGLKFLGVHEPVDKVLYTAMYNDDAWKNPQVDAKYGYAKDSKPLAIFHNNYMVVASMSNVGRSIVKLDVFYMEGAHEKSGDLFRFR